jgi:hypothetical protein
MRTVRDQVRASKNTVVHGILHINRVLDGVFEVSSAVVMT